ncbi:hypothetical protein BU16DRAFT_166379 [Lophium mytilinum]|uniref:Uncharacterized protein n=1 Tax=Lophium mytilinum TaxID=390894 RepID=A0A6A6QBN3_9PEZI|nr:hypothetical protein BU16DRAFT_166379 [Lophium mytilinum]
MFHWSVTISICSLFPKGSLVGSVWSENPFSRLLAVRFREAKVSRSLSIVLLIDTRSMLRGLSLLSCHIGEEY